MKNGVATPVPIAVEVMKRGVRKPVLRFTVGSADSK
ncbi:hypothetical protein CHKEEEPN_4789 [Methylorubrum podarium]|nr:hypothetical protein CHKEEEPN_4789 [Methylorubrum podarium]